MDAGEEDSTWIFHRGDAFTPKERWYHLDRLEAPFTYTWPDTHGKREPLFSGDSWPFKADASLYVTRRAREGAGAVELALPTLEDYTLFAGLLTTNPGITADLNVVSPHGIVRLATDEPRTGAYTAVRRCVLEAQARNGRDPDVKAAIHSALQDITDNLLRPLNLQYAPRDA